MAAKENAKPVPGRRRRRSMLWPIIIAALVAVVLAFGLHYAPRPESSSSLGEWDPTWPQMPKKGAAARPLRTTESAYAFVARRPDIAEYMPCYCGCEREGHKSLHDCFVDKYGSDGKPVWDQMGYT